MKKEITIAAILILAATGSVSAQWYVNLGMGYAIPTAGQTLDGTGTPYNGSINNSIQYDVKNASFSSGLKGNISIGYMSGANIGFQVDLGLGLDNRQYTFTDNNTIIYSSIYGIETITQQAHSTVIAPTLVLQTGGDPLNFYCRFGPVIPINTKIAQSQVYENYPGNGAVEIDDYTFTIKNSFSLGFAAAAGVQYKLSDRIKLWGEISLLSLSQYIKESDFDNVTENGMNVNNLYAGPTVYKYSKSVTIDTPNYTQLPAYSQPFSNVAFNVGVSFTISSKPEHKGSKHHIQSDNARLREERDN